jgi:uncharacterized protein YneF (UPF0154 family)
MINNLLSGLPIISIVFTIAAVLGGLYVFRKSQTKQLSELQDKVIETLTTTVGALESEIKRLRREVTAMRVGFKHLGMSIEISGDEIVLTDEQQPKRTRIRTVPIPKDEDTPEEK